MDASLNQLDQITNHIRYAHADDVKGLTRLHLTSAVTLLQNLSKDLQGYIWNLESVGEQPHEVLNFEHILDIKTNILDL